MMKFILEAMAELLAKCVLAIILFLLVRYLGVDAAMVTEFLDLFPKK